MWHSIGRLAMLLVLFVVAMLAGCGHQTTNTSSTSIASPSAVPPAADQSGDAKTFSADTVEPQAKPTAAEPAAPSPAALRAGFAQCDITPGRDAFLMGYGSARRPGNDGVHEPLYARVCALRDGDRAAVLVSFDLCVLPTPSARQLRQKIAEAVKTDLARVMVCATHTHSGPEPTVEYLQQIEPQVIDAAQRAAALTYPVTAWVREAPLGVGYNRRVVRPGRVLMCWDPQEYPDHDPQLAPDPTCTVLLFRQTNGPRQLVLWSLGVHPVVLGKVSRWLSPDYPGVACRLIEAELPGSRALFVLGAAGNVHPWIATQEDPRHVEPVAKAAASFVSLLTHAARPAAPVGESLVRCAAETVTIGAQTIDLAVWRVGHVWIVAAPVELFGELGLQLRERLGGPVLLATLANGWHGYWPTEQAFAEGGYEVGARGRGLVSGDGERLVDTLVQLAAELDPAVQKPAPSK